MMRFDRFTERAQDAAMRAYEIMQRYGHSQVDVEHVFLAMLEQPQGVVGDMLGRLGAPVDVLKERLTDNLQRTPRSAGTTMFPQQVAGLHHSAPEARNRSGDGGGAAAA